MKTYEKKGECLAVEQNGCLSFVPVDMKNPHYAEIVKEVVDGNAEVIDVTHTDEKKWNVIRARRNDYLKATDWRMLHDANQSSQWLTYRQALRDITKQSDPDNIEWPEPPTD